jgi:aminomethyltransferase
VRLKRTQLYEFHRKHGHLVEFAGFEMPLWYEGIVPEHLAVRNAVGIFDVSHMGRCVVWGRDAIRYLNYILSRDITTTAIGQGRYSVMCSNEGGIIDDLVVFLIEGDKFLMVYNASNRRKNFAWLIRHAQKFQVQVEDVSDEVAMFAVQGPNALNALQPIVDADLTNLRYFWGSWMCMCGSKVFVTRTGYTGEDGFEIFVWNTSLTETETVETLWQTILKAGQEHGIKACGLGARDTLRLEAGMCLYGNDINEMTTPLEAGLDFVAQLEKDNFLGKESLVRQKTEGIKRKRVGIRALDRGIPRPGSQILVESKEVGRLTSGTFSPLLKCGISMGYVPNEHSQVGTRLVLVHKSQIKGEIVDMPFYDTTTYGRKRIKT